MMPVIYLVLAAHALLLAPLKWWHQPTGWLMALLIAGGAVESLQSLTGQIGSSRRYKGLVQAVKQTSANITEVVCDMGKRWPGHQAGQFAQQIWVAGGIGITPFLAALEKRPINSKQKHPVITLHYCTAGVTGDPMVTRLRELMEQLPEISLHIHDSLQGQRLAVNQLQVHGSKVDVWFCGPQGLADAMRSGLKQQPISLRFHQESFEFR